jgi:hypothetical protein
LPRGEIQFFQVALSTLEVKPGVNQVPSEKTSDFVDSLKLARLQAIVSRVISYGSGPWVERLVRAPMLVQRHVATVIYESIPNQRPHDLEYGLDVLGSVIDSIGEEASQVRSMSQFNSYQWLLEVPSFVIGQIEREKNERLAYARKLASFLRARLVKWFENPALDFLSKIYIAQLVRLFSIALRESVKFGESFAPIVREITFLDRLGRKDVVIFVERELILLLQHQFDGERVEREKCKLVIKTMADVLIYSRTSFSHELQAETCVCALAISLFAARRGAPNKDIFHDLMGLLKSKLQADVPPEVFLRLVARRDEVGESWGWGLWELEQKESGEAHFLEMDDHLSRGALLMLSDQTFRLRTVKDQDLPAEHVLDHMIRKLDIEDWRIELPPEYPRALSQLKVELIALRDRRARIIAQKVEDSGLDIQKVKEYVDGELESALSDLAQYCEWISAACVVSESDVVKADRQFGISSLIPKECFVPDDVLDVSVIISNSGIGQAVQDFEIREVVRKLTEGSGFGQSVPTQSSVWDKVANNIYNNSPFIWLIGVGVGKYDVWSELEAARSMAEVAGVKIRFDNVDEISGWPSGILFINNSKNIEFQRHSPDVPFVAVYGRELSIDSGRIYCGITEISESMQRDWMRNSPSEEREGLSEKYRRSVWFRAAWSFEVIVSNGESPLFFPASALGD